MITDRPFTDLYETVDTVSYPASTGSIYFNARPVAGGHSSLLALVRRDELGGGNSSMSGGNGIVSRGNGTMTVSA